MIPNTPSPFLTAPRPLVAAALLTAGLAGSWSVGTAQTWTRITDPAHPVATESAVPLGSYAGASWADVDGDGWPDLHVSGRPLFRNLGGGLFAADSAALVPQPTPLGNTWADADNDGDLDCFVSGRYALLYENLGGTFARVTTSDVGDSSAHRGFASSFGDWDDDGLVDLVTCHFVGGLAGPANTNHLLHNEGGLAFTRDSSTPVSADISTYIIPSWTDLDDDGDLDLTIGRGPISSMGLDDFFRNRLKEDGVASFEKMDSGPLVTDLRDGQSHAWIDYDNDGDLDSYVVNYRAGMIFGLDNWLYRNDGGGTYTRMLEEDAGPIVKNKQISTGCVWEDFDNDGWIDCIVCNDLGKKNKVYRNLGDGSFELITDAAMSAEQGNHYAVVAADYDRDGDQDVFVSGSAGFAALYRNDLAAGNHWLTVTLEGTASNRAAVGARVRAKATIAGEPTWQMREIHTQTGSPGMSDLPVSFGLGDAAVVDSLVIEWPSDAVQVLTAVAADQFLDVVEPAATSVPAVAAVSRALLTPARPNPFTGSTRLELQLPRSTEVEVDVVDVRGRRVRQLLAGPRNAGTHGLAWDGRDAAGRPTAAGVYLIRVRADGFADSRKVLRLP